jgi:hypothetical protein
MFPFGIFRRPGAARLEYLFVRASRQNSLPAARWYALHHLQSDLGRQVWTGAGI